MASKFNFLFFVVVTTLAIDSTDAFRNNYTFIKTTDSYYKYHPYYLTWNMARVACESEGGALFFPEDDNELEQVLNVFGIDSGYLHVGMSQLASPGVYMTIDGRTTSQVFNKWNTGEPKAVKDIDLGCVQLNVLNRTLFGNNCDDAVRHICKARHGMDTVVSTSMEEIKTVIANGFDKLAEAIQQQALAIQAQSKIQNSALELLAKTIANQTTATVYKTEKQDADSCGQETAKQTSLLERFVESAVKQNSVLERLAEAAVFQNASSNMQIEAMVRQAVALEEVAKCQYKQQQ